MSEEQTAQKEEILGIECRFAVHIPARDDFPDTHLVKEAVHYKDGTIRPRIRYIDNFKRPFGVTRPQYRNHEQKKEFEELDKLQVFKCTQSELKRKVAIALNKAWSNADLRQLTISPYLYGTDVTSTTLIKDMYRNKWPDLASDYSVATYDIETDMVNGTEDPILITIVFKDMIYCVADRKLFEGYTDVVTRIRQTTDRYIKDFIDEGGFKLDIEIVDGPVELIRRSINKAHLWQPDFLAIWNMDFDIPRIIETLERYNVDPADIFCDPSLPAERRFCKYKKGSTKLVTASGQVKPKNPSQQWHSLLVPASFYVIDAMCSYRFLRQGAQEEQEYSLDHILSVVFKGEVRKLKFTEADHITANDKWHTFMQEKYPFEYTAYNIFDSLSMMLMERKTKDLASALPVQIECTDFAKFNSQTRKIGDQFYFHLIKNRGKMLGTIPPRAADEDIDEEAVEDENQQSDEDDENYTTKQDVMSLRGWINEKCYLGITEKQYYSLTIVR